MVPMSGSCEKRCVLEKIGGYGQGGGGVIYTRARQIMPALR
jgi:hypothetical protein